MVILGLIHDTQLRPSGKSAFVSTRPFVFNLEIGVVKAISKPILRTHKNNCFKTLRFYIKGHIRITCPCNKSPLNPTFYGENGVCMCMPIFLSFDPKHRLWVLVRTALLRRF